MNANLQFGLGGQLKSAAAAGGGVVGRGGGVTNFIDGVTGVNKSEGPLGVGALSSISTSSHASATSTVGIAISAAEMDARKKFVGASCALDTIRRFTLLRRGDSVSSPRGMGSGVLGSSGSMVPKNALQECGKSRWWNVYGEDVRSWVV